MVRVIPSAEISEGWVTITTHSKASILSRKEKHFTGSRRRHIGQSRREIETLQREEYRLQQEIAANVQFTPDPQDIRKACELVRRNLKGLSLEDKRQAMEILQVRV